jgi:tetratricopeptide (TPR) repeat protein
VLRKAKEYYKESQFERCRDCLSRFLRTSGQASSVELHYLLGMSLINTDDLQEGAKALNKAVELNPYYKKTLYLILALAYKRLGNYDEAIDIVPTLLHS